MNILSKIFTRNTIERKELAYLSPGELYIVRKETSPRGKRECIFREAEAMIVATSIDFCYQLLVKKRDDEEEEEGDGPSNTSSNENSLIHFDGDERQFLIDQALQLGYYRSEGRLCIGWLDLNGDDGDRYEFRCGEEVAAEAYHQFEKEAFRGMFGREHNRWPVDSDSMQPYNSDKLYVQAIDSQNEVDSSDFTSDHAYDNENILDNNESKDAKKSKGPKLTQFGSGRLMAGEPCDLYRFDGDKEVFDLDASDVEACVLDQSGYKYSLEIRTEDGALLSTPIDPALNPYSYPERLSTIFNYTVDANENTSYLIRFKSEKNQEKFESQLAIAQWEHLERKRWGSLSDSDQNFVTDAMVKTSIVDSSYLSNNSDDESESESESDRDVDVKPRSKAEASDYGRYTDDDWSAAGSGRTTIKVSNTGLEVGHSKDRNYVIRGDQIGVFKDGARGVNFVTAIKDVTTASGKQLLPQQVMLHQQDSALVIRDEFGSLHKMDLEVGRVVEDWDVNGVVKDIAPLNKHAQTTNESTLLGVAPKSLFKIDPRMKSAKVSVNDRKDYKTATAFSSLSTTAKGYTVVGSSKGDIRLYNALGTAAKVHLPSLGQPIKAIDVTADGVFVLATCKHYLLLVQAVSDTHHAFEKLWKLESRTQPIMLMIPPTTAAQMLKETGKEIDFTPAKFNTTDEAQSTTIVTSTGKYLITWDLKDVLRGKRDNIRVKRFDSDITSENFKYGTDKKMIVTLEDDVNQVVKSSLRKMKIDWP